MKKNPLGSELKRITDANHHDPFAVLGRHPDGDGVVVRAFIPGACEVRVVEGERVMRRLPDSDHFE